MGIPEEAKLVTLKYASAQHEAMPGKKDEMLAHGFDEESMELNDRTGQPSTNEYSQCNSNRNKVE